MTINVRLIVPILSFDRRAQLQRAIFGTYNRRGKPAPYDAGQGGITMPPPLPQM